MQTMAEQLAQQPFLAGMRPAQLERLAVYAHRSVFRAGARIFHEGGHANKCWIIRDGEVELDTTVPGLGNVTIEKLRAGAVLGWSWMFPPYTWHFGAVATQPVLTIEFKAAELLRLCEGDHELGYELTRRFMAVVVDRLQTTRARLIAEHVSQSS
jgi:CRP/FNR family transcriptional regulator, cyclic AMP receptor protein